MGKSPHRLRGKRTAKVGEKREIAMPKSSSQEDIEACKARVERGAKCFCNQICIAHGKCQLGCKSCTNNKHCF